MSQIEKDDFVKSLAYLLRETFEGSPPGQWSAYLDQEVGFFKTLAGASAEQASRNVNGTSAAAQTEHAKFYLDRLREFIAGRTEPVNWEQSWLIETVDDEEWAALCESVRRSYEESVRLIAEQADWNERSVGMAMAMLAHTAYHLGAVRQILKNR